MNSILFEDDNDENRGKAFLPKRKEIVTFFIAGVALNKSNTVNKYHYFLLKGY